MIPRYSDPEMVSIWETKNKYQIWFEIEAYAAEAMSEIGLVPKEAVKEIWEKGKFDIDKINEIEKVTKHDVIAFLTNLAESIGENSRFVHLGMTSSDILDTCLSIQLNQASKILINNLEKLLTILKKRAFEHKETLTMGRSHGIHAEPISFGLKLATYYAEFSRNLARLKLAQKEIAICAISGAVGSYANIDPSIQEYVAKKMGLESETISTQIIPRDRHAQYFATLGVIASSIERLATEIRHLQRTEMLEAEEYFSKGQKGSSAMPHKRNPVLSENLTGLARIVRGYVTPALENIALWHERDISHSSVERMIAPDATVTLDFALKRLNKMMEELIIYPENMQKNIDMLKGLVFSQRILLELTKSGVSRENAYKIVQRNAMEVWEKRVDFLELLKKDEEVTNKISLTKLDELFDMNYHTKNIDYIFNKVFA
ncbi:MAG: adenylosuccinate lyase [Rickettsiales bacterium]|nr:adenylosuccinate lyase [Rickettsiales bacterium]